MSFFGIGADPAFKVYTAESYPTQARAAGTFLTEGFGRLLSGVIGPSFIPLLLAAGGVAAVCTLVGAVALVAVIVVAFFGEETRGRPLEAITPPAVRRRLRRRPPPDGRQPTHRPACAMAPTGYRPSARYQMAKARRITTGCRPGPGPVDYGRRAYPRRPYAAQISEHLAGAVHRQGPCLQADHAVRSNAARLLGPPHCGGGLRAVNAVGGEHRIGPGAKPPVPGSAHSAAVARPGPENFRRGSAAGCRRTERGPGGRPDDAVDGEVARALELLDGRCGHRPENAVDLLIAQRLADDHEQVLRPSDGGPGRALGDGPRSDPGRALNRWTAGAGSATAADALGAFVTRVRLAELAPCFCGANRTPTWPLAPAAPALAAIIDHVVAGIRAAQHNARDHQRRRPLLLRSASAPR